MNFTLSDEQRMLRDSARDFLSARFPIDRVADIADGDGWDPSWWPEVAELGWTGISVPEEAGGGGMGFLEEMVVVEELGRALFPGPYLTTVVLALPALAGAPDLLEGIVAGKSAATLAWSGPEGTLDPDGLPVRAEGSAEGAMLTGTALFVPDLGSADLVVVAAAGADGPGLWAVERDGPGTSWEAVPTVDTTRPLGVLMLEGAHGRPLAGPSDAAILLERIRDRALASLAAEAVGVADRALELSVLHAKTREQFGRAVGAFQAVSHQLADALVAVESARSLAYWAGWAVANDAEEAPMAAAAAKAYAAEAAVRTCERAIQVHGGIGFTWEHPLHRYYKRALWIAAFLGWPSVHRARLAQTLLS